MDVFKIGTLAERTGTNPPTIRYYEGTGLLRAADRQAGGQRTYGEGDVRRLTFVRRCRDFGFSIEQVRALVALQLNAFLLMGIPGDEMLAPDPSSQRLNGRQLRFGALQAGVAHRQNKNR